MDGGVGICKNEQINLKAWRWGGSLNSWMGSKLIQYCGDPKGNARAECHAKESGSYKHIRLDLPTWNNILIYKRVGVIKFALQFKFLSSLVIHSASHSLESLVQLHICNHCLRNPHHIGFVRQMQQSIWACWTLLLNDVFLPKKGLMKLSS